MRPTKIRETSSSLRIYLSWPALLALGAGVLGLVLFSLSFWKTKPAAADVASIFLVDAERDFPHVTPLHGTLPGEFEDHEALLIGWPDDTLRDVSRKLLDFQNSMNHSILEIISHAQTRMRVIVVVPGSSQRQSVLSQLAQARIPTERVEVAITEINTRWVRDFGPFSLRSNERSLPTWVASKFFCEQGARIEDQRMARAFSLQQNIPPVEAPFFLDGGNLITDGEGLFLTTTQTLGVNRLLGYKRGEVSRLLREYLGARRIVYLEPLEEEWTGHVDMFLTMPTPETVVLAEYAEAQDPVNRQILERNLQRLREVPRTQGPLNIVRVPMPNRGTKIFGGTYTNVVYANGLLFVPKYGDVDDAGHAKAVEIYRQLLPDWEILSIESSAWIALQGSIHCLTRNLFQLPPRNTPRPRA